MSWLWCTRLSLDWTWRIISGCCRWSALTSPVGPAGLQAGHWDTVTRLWGVREVRQAAAPVLHPPDGTILQPRHDVSDWQTPLTVGRWALRQRQKILKTRILKINNWSCSGWRRRLRKTLPLTSYSQRVHTKLLQRPIVADLLQWWQIISCPVEPARINKVIYYDIGKNAAVTSIMTDKSQSEIKCSSTNTHTHIYIYTDEQDAKQTLRSKLRSFEYRNDCNDINTPASLTWTTSVTSAPAPV